MTMNFEYTPGQWVLAMANFACVSPDGGGDIILAKVTFTCQRGGDANITINTIPGMDTVVGCVGISYYDSQIPSNTITIHQRCTLDEECNDGLYCNGIETCEFEVCVPGLLPCDDLNECTEECDDDLDQCTTSSSKPYGTPCTDDGNICTDDYCTAGECIHPNNNAPCTDDGICTDDYCTVGECIHPNNNAPCYDGIFCNGYDTCSEGSCSAHSGTSCPSPCTVCNEDNYSCDNIAAVTISPSSVSTSTFENVLFSADGTNQCNPPCYTWEISPEVAPEVPLTTMVSIQQEAPLEQTSLG